MFDGFWDMLASEGEKQSQISELQAMSDRELADLGISRDQIEAFVDQHSKD